jgi:hypothetical protein
MLHPLSGQGLMKIMAWMNGALWGLISTNAYLFLWANLHKYSFFDWFCNGLALFFFDRG